MHVTITVSGYVDWVPVPEGTALTDVDYATKRVKKHGDDKPYMRTRMAARPPKEGEPDHHHDISPSEISIARRFASLVMLGRQKSRAQVMGEIVQSSCELHLEPDHYERFEVHHAAPNADIVRGELISERRLYAINQYRDLLARRALGDKAKQRDLDTWLMPEGTVIDEAFVAKAAQSICSDVKIEDTVDSYCDGYVEHTDPVTPDPGDAAACREIEDYLNATFGVTKKRRAAAGKTVTK